MHRVNSLSLFGESIYLKQYHSFLLVVLFKRDVVLNYAAAAHIFGLQWTCQERHTRFTLCFKGILLTT